jgi:hypothetical protein
MPKTGSAVWFTGNQDAHWRPDIEFEPEDYYDILLVQVWSDIENDEYPSQWEGDLKLVHVINICR